MATIKLVSIAWFLGLLVLGYLGRWAWSVRSVFSRCPAGPRAGWSVVSRCPAGQPAVWSVSRGGAVLHNIIFIIHLIICMQNNKFMINDPFYFFNNIILIKIIITSHLYHINYYHLNCFFYYLSTSLSLLFVINCY